jgi:hypothetical protein
MMDWRHCLLKGHVRRIAITNVGRVKSFVDDLTKGHSLNVVILVCISSVPFLSYHGTLSK